MRHNMQFYHFMCAHNYTNTSSFNVLLQVTTMEGELYEGRLVGLSVSGKEVSNLQQPVNITIRLSSGINVTPTSAGTPRCSLMGN